MPAKINDGLTNKQRYIRRHKERLLEIWREEKRRAYPAQRDKLLARGKAYREATPELQKLYGQRSWEKMKQKRLCNPEWTKQHDAALYARHRDYYINYSKVNREQVNATARDWYKRQPFESMLATSVRRAMRRARVKGADGEFCEHQIKAQWQSQYGLCFYCAVPMGSKYEIDHFVPLVKGGTNWIDNIVLACQRCNRSKGPRTEGWSQHWLLHQG